MTKPVSALTTFQTQPGPIPLSQLDTNLTLLWNAANDLLTYANYAVDTGVANAYVVTFPAGITVSYSPGLTIAFKAANSNTGNSTLNVNGLGTKTILNYHGTALSSNRIETGAIHWVIFDGTNFQLMTPSIITSGTFTGTITGMTAGLTPTVSWLRDVDYVTLSIGAGSTGTSNATTMTMTGIPSLITATTSQLVYCGVVDNAVNNIGTALIDNTGTITFKFNSTGVAFTNSGTKGLQAGWTVSYALI